MLGRQHAGQHGVVGALDARHVDEARRAADQRAAREDELRHRLPAALGDGARAVANALAARERVAHQRMGLEALEFLERREVRIVVVEMHDKTDRHQIVAEVIEERAAAGAIVERPAERCAAPSPGWCFSGATCHSSLRPMPNFCGSRSCVKPEARDQRFDELPRAPSANSVYLPRSSMPRVKPILGCAVLADTHVAGGDAGDLAVRSNNTSAAAKPG